jgi:hypothetical protein
MAGNVARVAQSHSLGRRERARLEAEGFGLSSDAEANRLAVCIARRRLCNRRNCR